jgi:hypothetical protein
MDEENFIPTPSPVPELNKQTFFSEYRNLIVLGGLLLTVAIVFLMNVAFSSKSITITSPFQSTSLKAGDTFSVAWSSKGIVSVGIVLFNGDTPQWLAKGVPAGKGKFDWTVLQNQDSGSNYRLAVFEYPWKKGNTIAYTQAAIQIVGPKYVSCNDLAVENEWPFVPGDYPNVKRVFVTDAQWNGNLGGLDGADAKCQQQADSEGYKGTFIAFLGTNKVAAKDRVSQTSSFAWAKSAATLPEGQDCYRLIARNVDSLLNKALLATGQMGVELDSEFSRMMGGVWYGRRTSAAKTECLDLQNVGATSAFSGTYDCQDWTTSQGKIYQGDVPPDADLPRCYDTHGNNVFANYMAADTSGVAIDGSLVVTGTSCDHYERLVCVEK